MSEDQAEPGPTDTELDEYLTETNEALIDGLPEGMSPEEFRATLARLVPARQRARLDPVRLGAGQPADQLPDRRGPAVCRQPAAHRDPEATLTEYPIAPGSALDHALNDIVAWGASRPQSLEGIRAQLALFDRDDPVHRLALSTRLHLSRLGVTDPATLVERLHARWYGTAART